MCRTKGRAMSRRVRVRPGLLSCLVVALCWGLSVASAVRADGILSVHPAADRETGYLRIAGAMDTEAMLPLITDFQALNPGITVEYTDYITNSLYEDADSACRSGDTIADILVSSSVDHMVRLANDGCAIRHTSVQTDQVPEWTQWRNEVYGFTYEPAVLVYHADHVSADDAPRSHSELADLLRRKPDVYFQRLGTYDLRSSGIGYLLAFLDAQQASTIYGRLLESMSRVGAVLYCCNSDVLRAIEAERLYIGYNILGSYAYAAQRRNPKLKIVILRDYTHILSRGVLLPKYAERPDLGARFLDYLLSPQGQKTAQEHNISFPRDDLPLQGVSSPSSPLGSGVGRPIRIGPSLLAAQDQVRRARFIRDWTAIMVDARPPSPEP